MNEEFDFPEMTEEEIAAREEAFAEWAAWENEVAVYNLRIFNAIENQLGKKYLQDVLNCLGETESEGKLSIVNTPNARLRQNEDWGSFNHVYVDQYVNGGMEVDSFAGWFYIPLKKGKYLKTHYSM